MQNSSEQYQFMSKSIGNGTLERLAKQRFCIKGKFKEIYHVDNQFQIKNADKIVYLKKVKKYLRKQLAEILKCM